MQIPKQITIIAAILTGVLLYVNLTYKNNPGVDTWTSFGLGITSVFFVVGLVQLFKGNGVKKQ